jgi:PHP family Zn ribbon phosphoesterase
MGQSGQSNRIIHPSNIVKTLRAEFHIHTVLSPCAEVEMIPPLIVSTASELGIQLIAITDHNSTANCAAVMRAAEGTAVTVLPGIELSTREEVHALCLFDTLDQASAFQSILDTAFPALENEPERYGKQCVVDHTGVLIRNETLRLSTSSNLSLKEAYQAVSGLGGLFIPAHVDRRAFGMISVLGSILHDIPFEALEISRQMPLEETVVKYPEVSRYPLLQSGDVHQLSSFMGVNQLTLKECSLAEIRKALAGKDGRKLRLLPFTF